MGHAGHPLARTDVAACATSDAAIARLGSRSAILDDLGTMSYAEVAHRHRTSRGSVYRIALGAGARKTETRIGERHRERERRQREALAEFMGATAEADVLEFLEAMPSGSVSLVATSPPYNIGKAYACDDRSPSYYLGWMMQVVSEIERVLKPGGTAFLQVGTTRAPGGGRVPLDIPLHDAARQAGLSYVNRVAWIVPHGLTPNRRLAERYETGLVMSKGPQAVFNPTPARTPQKNPDKKAYKGPRKGERSGHPLGAWPSDVWTISSVRHGHPERTGHPAQFPEELVRRAILLWTMPGDLVMDVFSGAGSTHAAAIQTGRRFIGCDTGHRELRDARIARVAPWIESPLPGIAKR